MRTIVDKWKPFHLKRKEYFKIIPSEFHCLLCFTHTDQTRNDHEIRVTKNVSTFEKMLFG